MSNIVAAGNAVTLRAAQRMLEAGGNAFDAAVAGSFAAMVAEPMMTSAGGGGCLMAAPTDSEPVLYDFFVTVPSGTVSDSSDFVAVDIDFGDAVQEFHAGRASAAVPGTVAGLFQVGRELGRLPMSDLLDPAIEAASQGIRLSTMQGYVLSILAPILRQSQATLDLFAPDGELLRAGDLLVMDSFADFLRILQREGGEYLYGGSAARQLCEWAENGGILREEDLASYEVERRRPLVSRFRDCDVLLNPPPAESGWLIHFTLSLLDRLPRGEIALHHLARALYLTGEARETFAGWSPEKRSRLPDEREFLAYVDRFLGQDSGLVPRSTENPPLGSTTHLSVLDAEGNAASVTSTNGEGCGHVLPELGFMLNNMLGEADLNPKGFHMHPAGTRLPTMMAPTVVLRGGETILVTGSAGSNRIRSAVVQILLGVLDKKMTIGKATEAPRIHVEGSLLSLEPGHPESEWQRLSGEFELQLWKQRNLFFGGTSSASPTAGAGDSRRGGCAAVFST